MSLAPAPTTAGTPPLGCHWNHPLAKSEKKKHEVAGSADPHIPKKDPQKLSQKLLKIASAIPFSPKTQKQECGHIFPSSLRRSHRLPRSSFSIPVATLAVVCRVPRWLQVGRLQRMCRERPHSPTTSNRDPTASILYHAASR